MTTGKWFAWGPASVVRILRAGAPVVPDDVKERVELPAEAGTIEYPANGSFFVPRARSVEPSGSTTEKNNGQASRVISTG